MSIVAPTPTTFIGRAAELEDIGALLADPSCRLLTLVGPGGIGKTRLALEIAEREADVFSDGIYLVPLAPISRTEDLLAHIIEATPFRLQQSKDSPREQFFAYLREKESKRLLLVLDNFEHLLAGAELISEMLAATSCLKILATSREPLNLREEWLRRIAGLAYPDSLNGRPLEEYSAVQLFLDRARRVRGDFDLTGSSSSVVEICRLVDGMPLAIELAVGWLQTLQPAEIAAEIRHNMDILATRLRNLPERHRSIRSVFWHSWQLLSADEREVFQKLSVFRDGFTRDAAEVVAGASLHTLAGLVDKSLLRSVAAGRYDIHELLRQYGAEQMEAAGETERVQQAYVEYYLGMLYRLEDDIKGRRQIAALDSIEAEFENIRKAWQVAIAMRNVAAISRAAESLHFFGDMRGRYHEVVALLKLAADQLAPTANPAQVGMMRHIEGRLLRLIMLGNMLIEIDPRARIEACLAEARARGDMAELGFCLMVSGIIAVWEEQKLPVHANARAAALFNESYAVNELVGDNFYMAEALVWAGSTTSSDEQGAPSMDYLGRSLDLRRKIGDRNGIAWITLNFIEDKLLRLDYPECERYAREALSLMREIHSTKGILQALFKLSQTTMVKGELEEARALGEEIRDLAETTNNIDGKVMWSGMQSFLLCVIDESYLEGAALAQQTRTLARVRFFGGHNDLGSRWGQAVASCGLGDYAAARLEYPALFWNRRDDPVPSTVCLALESAALAHEGDPEEAAALMGLAFHQPGWASGWLHRWALIARLRADLLRQLGVDAWQAAWQQGSERDLEATVRSILREAGNKARPTATHPALEAHSETDSPANQALTEPLSERELEVLGLLAAGLSNRDIAERLTVSLGTVKTHARNIYGKLNVNSRTQAIAQATRFNLL